MIRFVATVAWATSALSFFVFAQEALTKSFREDFIGSSLAPELRISNGDPNRMALVDGEHLLLLTHPDTKNWINYTGDLPEEYVVILEVASLPLYDYQGLHISLGDSENYMDSGFYLPESFNQYGSNIGKARFFTVKYVGDESSDIGVEVEKGNLRPFHIRVTKKGVEYISEYSFDGSRWVTIGTHVSVRPYPRVGFGVWTWGGEAPESPIRIDSFEIVDLTNR